MTFSSLTSRTIPNRDKFSSRRGQKIVRVNVHHWAGTSGGETRMIDPNADVSCNYLILSTGEVVGNVPEEYRAFTSGSWDADAPAITIEVQNSSTRVVNGDNNNPESWPISPAAYLSLINLIADIAKRYGWGAVTRAEVRGHREFSSTACPGGFLWHRLSDVAAQSHKKLKSGTVPTGPGAPGSGVSAPGSGNKNWYTDAVNDGIPGSVYWTLVQMAGRAAGMYDTSYKIDGIPGTQTRKAEVALLALIFNAAGLGKTTNAHKDGNPYNGSAKNFSNFVWLGQTLGRRKGFYPAGYAIDGIDGPMSQRARVRILAEWLNAKY